MLLSCRLQVLRQGTTRAGQLGRVGRVVALSLSLFPFLCPVNSIQFVAKAKGPTRELGGAKTDGKVGACGPAGVGTGHWGQLGAGLRYFASTKQPRAAYSSSVPGRTEYRASKGTIGKPAELRACEACKQEQQTGAPPA